MRVVKITIGALALCLSATSALADWAIQNEQSSVHYISTKNVNISEVNHFSQLDGTLKENGEFEMNIHLASVETGIEIRNTRMREKLFKVDVFPSAKITATVPKNVMQLEAGQMTQAKLNASLHLAGKQTPLILAVQVTKTQNGQYIASSIAPVLISATDFDWQPGIDTLQKLAGLSSISLTVPVTFNLVLGAD